MSETYVAVPYFDGLELPCDVDSNDPEAWAALDRFLQLGAEEREAATRHVHAYWADTRELEGAGRVDAMMSPPARRTDIWLHVQPRGVFTTNENGIFFVHVEADCDWEEEHGLDISWRDGAVLARVGVCGGPEENAHPDVIYEGVQAHHTTYRGS